MNDYFCRSVQHTVDVNRLGHKDHFRRGTRGSGLTSLGGRDDQSVHPLMSSSTAEIRQVLRGTL